MLLLLLEKMDWVRLNLFSFSKKYSIFLSTKGNEHHLAFHEQLMGDLDKMNEEDALENQGGIS
jgi:hypothetical protein